MLHNWLRFVVPRFFTNVVDLEAQSVNLHSENEYSLTLLDIPTSNLEAPSIKWLLETSTDPEVFLAAASLVPQVEWPLDLDVSDLLPQLCDSFTSCVGFDGRIVTSLEEKASACIMAISHLYCGRVLQAHPGRGRRDYNMFEKITQWDIGIANETVLAPAMELCLPNGGVSAFWWNPFGLDEYSDSVLEWLSHSLPYHFATGRANKDVEEFAVAVISKLLSSPRASSPSNEILANCTLLACVMVGVQFDKKDIIRIDKSSALPRFADALLTQFQTVLWAYDGGDLNKDSTGVTRRAWNLLDVICRILEPAKEYYVQSGPMRNLDMCKKIYSQARSSEQSYRWNSLNALRNALRFTLTAAKVSRDPAQLWYMQYSWRTADSHSPEAFDWLVDYLDTYFDEELAYDILLLLDVMKVRCSPAKQHQFFESLIACMDSDMPHNLRHIALRAAYNSREEIASIGAIDDELRDMILTKFSPAILTVVCPQPGATPTGDGYDGLFNGDHDLCYLKLIFTLARNSNWHPRLFGDHHIDHCISMVTSCPISHAFYLTGILLRIASEQLSVTSFSAITGQQWWDLISVAWIHVSALIDDIHCLEFLPVLVEATKKDMQIASEYDLEWLVGHVDSVLEELERRDSEQREAEGVVVAVKELRTIANDMREKLVNSKEVISL